MDKTDPKGAPPRPDSAQPSSEARLHALVEAMDDIAFEIHPDGTYLNIWAVKGWLLPRPATEMIGRRVGEFFGPDFSRPFYEAFERVLATGRSESIEYQAPLTNGRHWFLGRISPILSADGKQRNLCIVVRDITDRKRMEDSLHELAGLQIRVQDEERRRISRELHDSTSQLLAALITRLYTAKNRADKLDERTAAALEESIGLAEDISGIIRTASYLLHPPLLAELGLLASLSDYANGFAKRTGMHVELDFPEELPPLPEEIQISLYRIAQEGLANILRHSGSAVAKVRVEAKGKHLRLEISDEGRGIPPAILQRAQTGASVSGLGISGMRERVKHLGGSLEIRSSSAGTTIAAVLPLPAAASAP